VAQALERIRKVARERKKERFTALFHHISTELPYCFNTKLGGIADFKVGFWWEARGDWPMPNKRSDDDIIRDPEKWLLREQAKVMLDLFAEDCGRTPATLEEVREWAIGQNEKHLRFRVNRRLNVVLDDYENPTDSGEVPPPQPTIVGWPLAGIFGSGPSRSMMSNSCGAD
jgi:hypothetical protein